MTYSELAGRPGTQLIEFYATWCPHCHRMMPVVEEVKELLGDRAEVVQLDIDRNDEAATEAKAESVPTFIIYKDGTEVWRHAGEIDGEVLLSKVEAYI